MSLMSFSLSIPKLLGTTDGWIEDEFVLPFLGKSQTRACAHWTLCPWRQVFSGSETHGVALCNGLLKFQALGINPWKRGGGIFMCIGNSQ